MSPLEMDFSAGITSILGPNGCGKSNVVDSIRWVLGEQRTRILRNTKMENVLFNGTRLRKPLGMAEVFLSLVNEDHSIALDYEEVTIGRRLYRSGVSEYLINGKPARLKEIRNLLTDTGLGNSAYSIIERDMVERVISEKGQEKRHLLEEAAGVSRYRTQREEAERKIKATEQDLLRLVDILQELEKELRSLKYQMGKARRYHKLKEEGDALETVMLKATLHDLLEKKSQLLNEREQHRNIRLADDNEIAIRENRLQEMRVETAEFEKELQKSHEKRFNLSTELQRREERIAVHNERIFAARGRIDEDEEEIKRANERLAGLDDELDGVRTQREDVVGRVDALQLQLRDKESQFRDTARQLEDTRSVLRERKQLALDLVRRKAEERGALDHIERSITELTVKQDSIEGHLDELSVEETRRVNELSGIESEAAAQQQKLAALQNDLTRLTENLDRAASESADCDAAYAEAGRELAEYAEKREFLDRIKQEHTRWSDEALARYEGLDGVFADHVHVERRYRRCFEACLMPILRSLVATSREGAVASLRQLRNGEASRVQILFAGMTSPDSGRTPVHDGVIGLASDLIECDATVDNFVRAYLDGVVVVEDVDVALQLVSKSMASRVCTLDGVFFDGPGRIIVAGSDEIEMTVLEYDAKLEEITAALREAEAKEGRLREQRDTLAASRASVRKEIINLRGQLATERERYDALQARRRDTELNLVRVKQRISGLEEGIEETRASSRELRERLEAAQRALSGEAEDTDDTVDLAELEKRAIALERERETLSEEAGRLRVEKVALSGEAEALNTRIRNIETTDEELRSLLRTRREDIERCVEQTRLSEQDIKEARSAIASMHSEKDDVERNIDERTGAFETLKEARDALESEVRAMKDERDARRENLERVSVELAALEERVSSVVEKARENFNQDLGLYVADPTRFDPSEWEMFERDRLDAVREKLASFGPVNMLAVEEYDEKKERFDFLDRQRRDLEEARDALIQAIRRINREARRLLGETFAQVRDNFRSTFLTLFNGGEADLLFDSDDPLEAKICIVASPKGKRLHDISVLSTGEKALVALSFLLAIYLVKPSPFCVFDEVDAPLDDANITRFVRMLQSFTDHTQFIVITHNKKTMEAADNLYGVTMEEPGVSKLISVHLDDAERFQRTGTSGSTRAREARA